MGKKARAKLTKVEVSLPFGIGKAEWTPDESEQRAAWALYVELVTRIAVQPLPEGTGLVREALSSLHSVFATTRQILRDAGPAVGHRMPSTGGLAIAVLNKGLRPFLAEWHPKLQAWETVRPPDTGLADHEAQWPEKTQFREAFETLRKSLEKYALALSSVAGFSE